MTAETSPTLARQRAETSREIWSRRLRALAPLWTWLALVVVFSLVSDTFMRLAVFNNILAQVSILALFGTGMTVVLLTGQIDLSIASVAALSAMISGQLFTIYGLPEPLPTIAALGAATLLGLINGIATAKLRIPSFMSTLAMSLIASGLTVWVSKGQTVFEISNWAKFMGSQPIGGMRSGFMIMFAILALLIGHLVLRYTRFGRYIYMTGASPTAARLAGVSTDTIIIAALTICGLMAGVAGVVNMGRLGSAQPQVIQSFLIEGIAVVVLGGTSLTGGRGSMWQTVLGLLIYGTLRNGLDNIAQIDSFAKEFITGLVLLIALIINVILSGRAERDQT